MLPSVFFRRESKAQVCPNFSELLSPAEPGWLVIGNHSVESGELTSVFCEKSLQLALESGSCGIGMNADGPEPGLFSDRLPKLLWNPEDVVAHDGAVGETIGQDSETLGGKGTEGVEIKSVTGGNEQTRVEAVFAKEPKSGTNPFPLLRFFDACEFSFLVQPEKGLAMTGTEVPVAMHSDGGSGSFE